MGDDGFEDFVANGGEDALVVVEAEGLKEVGISVESGRRRERGDEEEDEMDEVKR